MNGTRQILCLVALTAVAAAGCTERKPVPLQRAQTVPAATGQIEAAKTGQGNTKLEVEVEHLAPPQNVAPGAQVYIVWAQAKDAPPQNVGAMMLDKDLKGKLETVTPLDTFHVSITPEASPNAQTPTNEPIMSADVTTDR